MPNRLKSKMITTRTASSLSSTPKYNTMMMAIKISSSSRNLPWVIK